jgi:NTP pyrophosphatase (non-canonical NTP hydrolase)
MKEKRLEYLSKKILQFSKTRGWSPSSSDLAKSIVIEAAELLEKFQWDETEKRKKKGGSKNWEEVGDEMADVFWYLVLFCDCAKIDMAEAIEKKYQSNERKYPASKFKGKHNEKFYMAQKRKYRLARKKK